MIMSRLLQRNDISPKKSGPSGPPEGFVDNTVYRYRIDENGNKVLIGTMEAYPEGWERPKQFREKGFQKKKEEGYNS